LALLLLSFAYSIELSKFKTKGYSTEIFNRQGTFLTGRVVYIVLMQHNIEEKMMIFTLHCCPIIVGKPLSNVQLGSQPKKLLGLIYLV